MKVRGLQVWVLAAVLALPMSAFAEKLEEKPSGFEMAADLVVARPIGIAMLALGSVTFVATYPFSMLGGNTGDAAETLVVEPAKEAFVRCLGCRRPGRKERIGN